MPRMMMRQQLHDIVAPHDHDVLSGRGNFVNYHAGNEHFRSLVRKHKVAYVACPKQQKGKFSRLIVEEIRARNPPGRFLKQDPSTKLWHDIGEKKALDKTRQALREGAPDIMKEIGGDDDPPPDGGDDDSEGEPTPPMTTSEPSEISPSQLPTNSTHSQQHRFGPGGPQNYCPADEIVSSGTGVPFMMQGRLSINEELLAQHSQHGDLGRQSQHGGVGLSQLNNIGHNQLRNPLCHSQHGNPLGHSNNGNPQSQHNNLGHNQHTNTLGHGQNTLGHSQLTNTLGHGQNPLGHSQHANPLGHSQHANPLGHSQHSNPLGHSQHANPLGHSQHANAMGHNQHINQLGQHANAMGHNQQANRLGHGQHTNPLGQHSQNDGGFTPANVSSSMQNGMRSLADLRQQMQQQHQRQQRGFSGGNFLPGQNNVGGAMFSPDVSLQNKLASLTQMQQAMCQQSSAPQPIGAGEDDSEDDFEFEPRPIAPGIATVQQSLPYPQVSGVVNESVGSMSQLRKASAKLTRRDFQREGSDRSLEMNSVFSKELGVELKTGQSGNLSGSAGSIMSLSIGDIEQDIDDGDDIEPMPPPKSLNPQILEGGEGDPSELSAMFDSSMRLKGQKSSLKSSLYDASDLGRGLDMSVATLGDSSALYTGDYNGDASMGTNFTESFSNVFDING